MYIEMGLLNILCNSIRCVTFPSLSRNTKTPYMAEVEITIIITTFASQKELACTSEWNR